MVQKKTTAKSSDPQAPTTTHPLVENPQVDEEDQDEEEADLLRRLQELEEKEQQLDQADAEGAGEIGEVAKDSSNYDPQAQAEVDSRSIYVGGFDYAATDEDARALFDECGTINRVTIPKNQMGQPKGFCYIEFASVDSVAMALLLTDKEIKGRKITVVSKRTNVANISRSQGGARGRGRGGRGGMMAPPGRGYPPMGYPPHGYYPMPYPPHPAQFGGYYPPPGLPYPPRNPSAPRGGRGGARGGRGGFHKGEGRAEKE